MSNTVVAYALSLSSWGVICTDGILDQDLEIHTQCGDGSAAISTAIIPGTHTKTTVVVTAPTPAAFLRLDNPGLGGWQWATHEPSRR